MTTLREHHRTLFPDFPWLSLDSPLGVDSFARARGWIAPGELLRSVEKAGEGNMNLTLRVRAGGRSFILKQARPWVEKYDFIPAPWDRMKVEQAFYRAVAPVPAIAGMMPRLIGADTDARAISLEDLPGARDLSGLYSGGALDLETACALGRWLRALHDLGTEAAADSIFTNHEMRALNHEHIYALPLRPDNGLDLDKFEPGLRAAADSLAQDEEYVRVIHETGGRYLADYRESGAGATLLHGDFFPGSWLETDLGPRVIDPEFCFCGPREFDLGFALAHLALARQAPEIPRAFLAAYADAGETSAPRLDCGAGLRPAPEGDPLSGQSHCVLDASLLARFAAAEIMRRLIGVAQLPIPPTTDGWRRRALERSRAAALEGSIERIIEHG